MSIPDGLLKGSSEYNAFMESKGYEVVMFGKDTFYFGFTCKHNNILTARTPQPMEQGMNERVDRFMSVFGLVKPNK